MQYLSCRLAVNARHTVLWGRRLAPSPLRPKQVAIRFTFWLTFGELNKACNIELPESIALRLPAFPNGLLQCRTSLFQRWGASIFALNVSTKWSPICSAGPSMSSCVTSSHSLTSEQAGFAPWLMGNEGVGDRDSSDA